VQLPRNAKLNLALFDVDTPAQWWARYATVTPRRWKATGHGAAAPVAQSGVSARTIDNMHDAGD
jgi:hypothetical protein